IVERYQSYLYRTALAFLGSPEDAEDSLQEIFIKVYRYLGTFKLGNRFRPWIYTIAINHLRKQYKKKKNIIQFTPAEPEFLESLPDNSAGTNPLSVFEKKEVRAEVNKAISNLKGDLKEVVILYYINEMSVEEVAQTLKLGKENVKSRLFRARKILKNILKKDKTELQ
ncbi:MAG: sigma-70 family RNA polymerase sigma factor, partial [Spirochaetales bacterium]|nr:sigma-70 family RNA polymerase sigma factor [Spirochaetales bacterium]